MSVDARRLDELADAIDEQCSNHVASTLVDHSDEEVYVRMEKQMHYADEVIAVAYDRGFVPVGIVEEAFRLRPRDNPEITA